MVLKNTKKQFQNVIWGGIARMGKKGMYRNGFKSDWHLLCSRKSMRKLEIMHFSIRPALMCGSMQRLLKSPFPIPFWEYD